MEIEISVGLIIITYSHLRGYEVLLQRRGWQDHYPGIYQVATHGGRRENESNLQALKREAEEELGPKFCQKLNWDSGLIELNHKVSDGEEVWTYFTALVPEEDLDLLKAEQSSGGFDHVTGDIFFNGKVIKVEKTPDRRAHGYPSYIWAMFPDEIEAVREALKMYIEI